MLIWFPAYVKIKFSSHNTCKAVKLSETSGFVIVFLNYGFHAYSSADIIDAL